ncbi:hypothetical protein CO038_00840 [Candidatus Pacearchaeota archaeon CG_4_9_14_0_2_um_filter_39_13]|nr:hypothetical protein [Candidatus Pacearchaeota archaeon]OIO42953.1 MAG: hypothetical protein AUJ64_03205 [Candidatus Pacearchaeota archaeon CG1_02_39_14]PJC44981.1 MAG: hypothetical protein CO038_00840 [Candidatus Pacearchaeota archaeon CG_4_9_14_0_2_um_filter_39_13]
MNTKFKRHQEVRLLISPVADDIEPYADPPKKIEAGMTGKINLVLPNGRYHVEVIEDGETIAYVAMDEDQLELIGETVPDNHDEEVEDWA